MARSAAQKAATKKMLAANKAKKAGDYTAEFRKAGKTAKKSAKKASKSKPSKAQYSARAKRAAATRKKNKAAHMKQLKARKSYKGGKIPLELLKKRQLKLNRIIASRKG